MQSACDPSSKHKKQLKEQSFWVKKHQLTLLEASCVCDLSGFFLNQPILTVVAAY
jgi:hypothetical protein